MAVQYLRINSDSQLDPQALQDSAPVLSHLFNLFCTNHIALPTVPEHTGPFCRRTFAPPVLCLEPLPHLLQVSLQMSPTQRGFPNYPNAPANCLTRVFPSKHSSHPVIINSHFSITCFLFLPLGWKLPYTLPYFLLLETKHMRAHHWDPGHLKGQGHSIGSLLPTPKPCPRPSPICSTHLSSLKLPPPSHFKLSPVLSSNIPHTKLCTHWICSQHCPFPLHPPGHIYSMGSGTSLPGFKSQHHQ